MKTFFQKLERRLSTHPIMIGAGAVVLVGLFAAFPVDAQALKVISGGPSMWMAVALSLINILLYQILSLIELVNIVLTHILIGIVQFNTFVAARPVEIGWPLVRDVVNMFFIVVLLIIAFSTIIGYKEFHYKNYLPKLLLMAVLINFSKTLVGLMIDFSQVITLTFVNGFKQAAFGNFAKAFNYDKLLTLNGLGDQIENAQDGSQLLSTATNVFITLVFGIVLMTIVATVLTIMLIYFAVRIVLLWILLIFSPIAFFALALPNKMKAAVAPAAGDWWKRLGSLLSGGPIVCFFLWLTLATIQGSASPFEGVYKGNGSEAETGTNKNAQFVGITQAGMADNISTFLVAIIMLLTGLQTAVSVSKEAAPQLGKVAEKIRSSGGPVMWGARGAYKAGKYGAKKADQAFQVTSKLGSALIQQGQATAASGKLGALSRGAGGAVAGLGGKLKGVQAGRVAGLESALKERVKHLPPGDRMRALDVARRSGNAEKASVAKMQYGEAAASGAGMKMRQGELEEIFKGKNPIARGLTGDALKQALADQSGAAKAWASGMSKREAGSALDEAIKAAEGFGKTDVADKLKEQRSKDPSLHVGFTDLSKIAANRTDDHKELFKGLKTEAWQDSATFLAMMKAVDLVNDNGTLKADYEDSDAWKELMKNGGNRAKYVRGHAKHMESASGQEAARLQLSAMVDGADAATIKQAENARYSASIQGNQMYYANMAPGGSGSSVSRINLDELSRPTHVEGMGDLVRNLPAADQSGLRDALRNVGLNDATMDQFAKQFSRPITVEQDRHVRNNAAVYANPPSITGPVPTADQARQIGVLAQGQAMGIRAPESAQKHVIEYAIAQAASPNASDRVQGAAAIANIDTEGIKENPDIQRAVVEAIDGKIDELGNAFKASANDADTMKKMEQVIRSVSSAGQAAAQKALSQQISDVEQRLIKIGDEIRGNKVLKKATDRKKDNA